MIKAQPYEKTCNKLFPVIIYNKMGDQWNTSLQSKEQIEASLVSRQEAAARRERALAYAFSHQVSLVASYSVHSSPC
ncbi:unnamed protein product [Triticum turgidum subsp. durum]|uniref:Uncharacterized protein n=1 Tax=Triticum turgidum subsp. durum TaxID=4567 RepID=A0A9R0S569_TRITD|nr:unnamed protein product [Triticum turgidum subsp. durum]